MKKLIFIFLSLFCCNKIIAQFVGSYSMRDGGVDVQSSALHILKDHEFMIFYLGGFKKGTWKEIDKNTIELSEVKIFTQPIMLFGKNVVGNDDIQSFDVENLAEAASLLRFSKDQNFTDEMKPVFNYYPNCMDNTYVISNKNEQYNYLKISVPSSPEFGHFGIRYPYKVNNYVFPLDKKYNTYTFVYSEDASYDAFSMKIIKKGDDYILGDQPDAKKTKREDFEEDDLADIEASRMYIEKLGIREDLGTKISDLPAEKEIVYKLNPDPYFKSYCEGSVEDSKNPDRIIKPFALKPLKRENGIYTISNYNPNNIKSEEFVVANKSSLDLNDFMKAEKIVSDYDGYVILVTFTEQGTEKFKKLLKKNPDVPVAFVLNNKVVDFYDHYMQADPSVAIIGYGIAEKEIELVLKTVNNKK